MSDHEITKEIEQLKARNERVEADKAWEVSWTRRLLIALITFIVASIWLWVIEENNVFLKAVIPTAGYILSTFSIPLIKRLWMKNVKS